MNKKVIELPLNLSSLPLEKQYALYFSTTEQQKKYNIIDVLVCTKDTKALSFLRKIIKEDKNAEVFVSKQILWIGKENLKKAIALANRIFNKSYKEILIDRDGERTLSQEERGKLKEKEKQLLTAEDRDSSYSSLYSRY